MIVVDQRRPALAPPPPEPGLGEAASQVRSKMTTGSGMLRSPATQKRTARGVTPRCLAAFVWFIPKRFKAARNCLGVMGIRKSKVGTLCRTCNIGTLFLPFLLWLIEVVRAESHPGSGWRSDPKPAAPAEVGPSRT